MIADKRPRVSSLLLVLFTSSLVLRAAAADQSGGGGVLTAGDLNPHPPFVEEPGLWDPVDPSRPVEHQVVQMTGADYDRLVTDRLTGAAINSEEIWVLLFVNPANTVGDGIDDKRAM